MKNEIRHWACLSYTEDKPGYNRIQENVSTFNSLIDRLRGMQQKRVSDLCIGVNLENDTKNVLAIGLCDDRWAVLFGDKESTFLCYSVGDLDSQGDIELQFQEWEVISRKNFIPASEAIEAIRDWFETGELSHKITWEQRSLLSPNGNRT